MSIEPLARAMAQELSDSSRPAPCDEGAIEAAGRRFMQAYGERLPDAYKRILRVSDGVLHNGLTIWPVAPHPVFRQTIFEANEDLRDSFDERYLYFGQWDEELYVYDLPRQRYCAIEFVGKPVWNEFDNDEQMFEFMLRRAWE
jgi:hypothetical protein